MLASALALNAVPTAEREMFLSKKQIAREGVICEDEPGPIIQRRRTIPPFVLSHDVVRGALHSLQALLSYALMLAVM